MASSSSSGAHIDVGTRSCVWCEYRVYNAILLDVYSSSQMVKFVGQGGLKRYVVP
jgi:hypothetical protein